jgi:type IV pilus assembly protein PilB
MVREALGGGDINDVRYLETLLAQGYIEPKDLKTLVQGSRRRGLSLAEESLATNVLTGKELTEVLSLQYRIPMVDVTQERVDLGFAKLMDSFHARQFGALPIRYDRETEKNIILITRPDNLVARDEVPLILNLDRNNIEWRLIDPEEFEGVLQRVYEGDEDDNTPENLDLRADSNLDSRAVKVIQRLVANAQTQGASDIHFERTGRAEMRVRYRLDGVLHTVETLDNRVAKLVIGVLKGLAKIKYDEARKSQDGRIKRDFGYGTVNLRLVTMPTPRGEEIVLRILDNRMTFRTFDELGLDGQNIALWEEQLRRKVGMIIVTGITGAGKTTTLYAALKQILNEEIKIITIEDPVETEIDGMTQIAVNAQQGVHFADQLVSILRADPDVIMIGEVRDRETANVAVEAALTGHLVLTTLHTKDAIGAITRLAEMGVERYLLADSLSMITAQRLVRKLCVHCRVEHKMTRELAQENGATDKILGLIPADGIGVYHASEEGCARCRGTGYRGRVGIHEVIPINDVLMGLITSGASGQELRAQAAREGYTFLQDDVYLKILAGETDLAEYKRVISTSL